MKRLLFAAWRTLAGLSRPSKTANVRRLRERGETAESLTIREATAADVPALARLHVTTWNATYAPLLMKGPGYGIRESQWRDALAKNDGSWFCFVVQRPDGEHGNGLCRLGRCQGRGQRRTGSWGRHLSRNAPRSACGPGAVRARQCQSG